MNNIELMKSIQSPERMFRSNYTPVTQYQELHDELNAPYKAHRGIDQGFEKLLISITKGENVFQKKLKLKSKFNSTTSAEIPGGIFMTSLLKNSKQIQQESIEEENSPSCVTLPELSQEKISYNESMSQFKVLTELEK